MFERIIEEMPLQAHPPEPNSPQINPAWKEATHEFIPHATGGGCFIMEVREREFGTAYSIEMTSREGVGDGIVMMEVFTKGFMDDILVHLKSAKHDPMSRVGDQILFMNTKHGTFKILSAGRDY